MKICETIQQSLQHVKTSLGTAVAKASETVKKVSRIALNTLKWLFSPITYLCTRAKSFFDKKHEQPSRGREASASDEILARNQYRQTLTRLIELEEDPSRKASLISQLNDYNDRIAYSEWWRNMTDQQRADYEKRIRERASMGYG
jgi:hypothetical protein